MTNTILMVPLALVLGAIMVIFIYLAWKTMLALYVIFWISKRFE